MKKLFTLCLAALAMFAFVACDDDNDSGSSGSIVGTWFHSENEEGFYYYSIFVFDEGLTFEHYDNDNEEYLHGTYLYIPERNVLQLDYSVPGYWQSYWISVAGDRMTLRYRDEMEGLESPEVYTRQK